MLCWGAGARPILPERKWVPVATGNWTGWDGVADAVLGGGRARSTEGPKLGPLLSPMFTHTRPDLESVSHAGREGGRLSQHGNGRRGRQTPQVQNDSLTEEKQSSQDLH